MIKGELTNKEIVEKVRARFGGKTSVSSVAWYASELREKGLLKGGKKGDRLESISSDGAASIEMHDSRMMNGMMTMQPLTGVDVPMGSTVAFREGGSHAMLFGLDPTVKPAATMALRFTFQSGKTIDVAAPTISAGDDMPEMSGHEGH